MTGCIVSSRGMIRGERKLYLKEALKGVSKKMTVMDNETISGKQQHINLIALDEINGYKVRPGFYEINGATPIPGGINFLSLIHI